MRRTGRTLAVVALATLAGCALSHERPTPQRPIVRPMDLNGDGYADLAVGSWSNVSIYLGSPAGVRAVPDQQFDGHDVRSLGDIDGDGRGDLGIGAGSIAAERGVTTVILAGASGGVDRGRQRIIERGGPEIPDGSASVQSAGDLDGDGLSDLVVTTRSRDGSGQLLVLHGNPSLLGDGLPPIVMGGDEVGGTFFLSVPLADIDGDGLPDFARIAGASPTPLMITIVEHGREVPFVCPAELVGDGPCSSMLAAGDIDGDGHDDVVTTDQTHAVILDEGRVPGTILRELAAAEDASSVVALAAGTDLDGDLQLDVVLLVTLADTRGFAGTRVLEIHWGSGEPPTRIAPSLRGTRAGPATFSEQADASGDLNGDGAYELVVHEASDLDDVVHVFDFSESHDAPRITDLRAAEPSTDPGFGASVTTGG
jgi:hypothetical protein